MVSFPDTVLFDDVLERKELPKRARRLIAVAAVGAGCNPEQISGRLRRAKGHGLTEAEPKEGMTHLAFYAGWPKAMSALTVAKHVVPHQEVFAVIRTTSIQRRETWNTNG
jgi:4-carboxymuconolactone decarboxylase